MIGLAPDVFLTTDRATIVLSPSGFGPLSTSVAWRWLASLVLDAHCILSHFRQPAVQTRRRTTCRAAEAQTSSVPNRSLPWALGIFVWQIPSGASTT